MEARIVPEPHMLTFQGEIPQDAVVTFLKLVLMGPKTLKKTKGDSAKLAQILAKQSGFFLITDLVAIRSELHKLVDRYCDTVENNRNG